MKTSGELWKQVERQYVIRIGAKILCKALAQLTVQVGDKVWLQVQDQIVRQVRDEEQ